MDKKALRYTVIIGILVGALVLFVTAFAWTKFGNLFINNKDREINVNFFEALVSEINNIHSGEASKNFVYQLKYNYAIVGFDKINIEPLSFQDCDFGGKVQTIAKPQMCIGETCLCIFEKEGKKLINCELLPDIDNIISVHPSLDFGFNEAPTTYYYGCIEPKIDTYIDGLGFIYNGQSYPYNRFIFIDGQLNMKFDVKSLYLEKFRSNQKNVLLIMLESDYSDYRFKQKK